MIKAKIEAAGPDEVRRKERRIEIEVEVPLREHGQAAVEARLINLSSRGFMAETDSDIPKGSRVWLTLPDGNRVSALIIWTKGGRLGGQFTSPIDPLVIFQALGRKASSGANPFVNVGQSPSGRSGQSR